MERKLNRRLASAAVSLFLLGGVIFMLLPGSGETEFRAMDQALRKARSRRSHLVVHEPRVESPQPGGPANAPALPGFRWWDYLGAGTWKMMERVANPRAASASVRSLKASAMAALSSSERRSRSAVKAARTLSQSPISATPIQV